MRGVHPGTSGIDGIGFCVLCETYLPLVGNILLMAIEIVDLPINSMVI